MIDAREYLRSQGFTVGQRGRFSTAMKEALVKGGYALNKPAVKAVTIKSDTTTVVNKPKVVVPNRRGYKYVHIDDNGKRREITNASACGQCGYSLVICYCAEPTALVKGILHYVPVVPV